MWPFALYASAKAALGMLTFQYGLGFAAQDASLQESMGPIQDRTRETLTSTDLGIVQARRKLMAAAAHR